MVVVPIVPSGTNINPWLKAASKSYVPTVAEAGKDAKTAKEDVAKTLKLTFVVVAL